ncbi:hypothetical protein [Ideonella oryzae]|uniref:Uncharacterized protein n=1 Tax=Ideonella oryzae TaxID=2937441 RepID=A0ABT1BPJ6_9BURK|nr:hypothetical protein [Ideonella oryzae]MCO5978138.1 hypothetical protein [Ideonella oryzae]
MSPAQQSPAPVATPESGANGGAAVTARQQALARLTASRSRLRAQVVPARHAGRAGDASDGLGLRIWWRFLRRELGQTPVGLAALSWIERWWQRQPLSTAAELGAAELRATVLPVVRRHPVVALAGAALLGGALVASRRWLWSWAGRRAGAWRGSLGAWVWRQARDPAVQLLVMAWLQQMAAARPQAGGAPPEAGAQDAVQAAAAAQAPPSGPDV